MLRHVTLRARVCVLLPLLLAACPSGFGGGPGGGPGGPGGVPGGNDPDAGAIGDIQLLDGGVLRPDGWDPATHEDPVDDSLFRDGDVVRIDIDVRPQAWSAFLGELHAALGEPGDEQPDAGVSQFPGDAGLPGGGGGGGPPPDGGVFPPLDGGGFPPPPLDGGGFPPPLDGGALPPTDGGPLSDGGAPPPDDDGSPPPLIESPRVPCNVRFGAGVWTNVALELALDETGAITGPWASGSLKLPWRMRFDVLADEHPEIAGQRFFGWPSLSLVNAAFDDSLARERLGEVAAAGVAPALRGVFARLYIDFGEGPQFFGLYTLVEDIRGPFLAEHFAEGGTLYAAVGDGARLEVADLSGFIVDGDGDVARLDTLVDALHAAAIDREAWRANLESILDVDSFLRALAVITLTGDNGSYGSRPQGFALYDDPASGRFGFLLTRHSRAFAADASGVRAPSVALDEIGPEWPLIRFIIEDDFYRAVYFSLLAELLGGPLDASALNPRLDETQSLLDEWVNGNLGEEPGFTNLQAPARFAQAYAEIRAVASARRSQAALLGVAP